ncbi:NAD-dependent epimerase/dehydratase family protein [Parafrankia elaeagni]|uniref:NAD-dependent epimerase/dehydratase family protein n=1 Tax=Parafrankia elaeagni TaxID=222534 RepID=UPI0003A004E1|nr:NAD-dependent epimerase/dehydratase family protein [Parafrankia elaeagni]
MLHVRVLVTGGTGKVGGAVVRASLRAGHKVRAVVRDVIRARAALPPEVEVVPGDVTDAPSLTEACDGCEIVYNAMGVPEQWLADPALFVQINVQGSVNITRAAVAAGVKRLVHTSTIDVFAAPPGGRFDETNLAGHAKGTAYERSKQQAEQAVIETAGTMEIVFVNLATVYGLGPTGNASLESRMFRPVLRGTLPAVPAGGFGVVFTEGQALGHLLAAERGRPGERYILCDEYATLMHIARTLTEVAGRGRAPLTTVPAPLMSLAATVGELTAKVTHRPPPIARCQLQYLRWNAVPDSSKAQKELDWHPTPLAAGLHRILTEAGGKSVL